MAHAHVLRVPRTSFYRVNGQNLSINTGAPCHLGRKCLLPSRPIPAFFHSHFLSFLFCLGPMKDNSQPLMTNFLGYCWHPDSSNVKKFLRNGTFKHCPYEPLSIVKRHRQATSSTLKVHHLAPPIPNFNHYRPHLQVKLSPTVKHHQFHLSISTEHTCQVPPWSTTTYQHPVRQNPIVKHRRDNPFENHQASPFGMTKSHRRSQWSIASRYTKADYSNRYYGTVNTIGAFLPQVTLAYSSRTRSALYNLTICAPRLQYNP